MRFLSLTKMLVLVCAIGLCLITDLGTGAFSPPEKVYPNITIQPETVPASILPRKSVTNAIEASIPISDVERKLSYKLSQQPEDPESLLLQALLHFRDGDCNTALSELNHLTTIAPKFHLAHLIRGDLLLMRTQPLISLGQLPGADQTRNPAIESKVSRLREEASARVGGYLNLVGNSQIPSALLIPGEKGERIFIVEKGKNRLYIFESQGTELPPRLLYDFYIVIGKAPGNKQVRGDMKTPEGIYYVTGYIPDNKLPAKYGSGAFPISYPNDYDRQLGRTGSGIWLHGTDYALYSRPPLDSEGCVVMTNADFDYLRENFQPKKTPVVIYQTIKWLDGATWLRTNRQLRDLLNNWRTTWEGMDLSGYAQYYSEDFHAKGLSKKAWLRRKKQIFAGKTFQHIELENIAAFAYPQADTEGQEFVVADFIQHYRSNNLSGTIKKRLYLTKRSHKWQIQQEKKRL